MTITLTKQEISDLTISCETMMEQLNDDIQDYGEGFVFCPEMKVKYYRIWDLRNKLNK
jgi:anthranilate phosphoribosyltransferase